MAAGTTLRRRSGRGRGPTASSRPALIEQWLRVVISVGLASTALIQLSGAAQVVTLLGAGALLAVTGLAGCTRPAESRRCGELIGGRARAMLKAEGCAGRAPPWLEATLRTAYGSRCVEIWSSARDGALVLVIGKRGHETPPSPRLIDAIPEQVQQQARADLVLPRHSRRRHLDSRVAGR